MIYTFAATVRCPNASNFFGVRASPGEDPSGHRAPEGSWQRIAPANYFIV